MADPRDKRAEQHHAEARRMQPNRPHDAAGDPTQPPAQRPVSRPATSESQPPAAEQPSAAAEEQQATGDAPPRGAWAFLKRVGTEFSNDECTQMAAALAYYAIFSIAPLLLIAITIASLLYDPQDVEGAVQTQLQETMGPEAAGQLQTMIANAQRSGTGTLATVLGGIAILVGATGVVGQLQVALNKAWDVQPSPEAGGIKNMIWKRILSLGLILVIGFLLLASLLLGAVVSAFGEWFAQYLPSWLSQPVLMGANIALSFIILTLLFATVYKVLPDAKLQWRDVWIGAAVTALLFEIGRVLIGLYLGYSAAGSAYGAAGSLVIILLWVYYSSLIVLIGAEFTQVWARRYGQQIQPAEGAISTR